MNIINSTILNAHVANETLKRVNGSCDYYGYANKHTRENDRIVMWAAFMFGMALGITYLFTPSHKDGIADFCYILAYLVCGVLVTLVSWDEKQSKSTIKTSLVMSVILAVIMLVPFILDMDTQIHFRVCMGGYSYNDGPMHYFYNEYTDYTNMIQMGIMIIICLGEVLFPIYRMKKL